MKTGRSIIPDLPLIQAEAEKALGIFDNLRLPDVHGKPKLATAAGNWQRELVAAIFGSFDPETAQRHIRDFFVMVPKKSSKTTAGAAIMVTALLKNKRPKAEFLLIAPSLEIADLAFQQAAGMIEADEVLAAMFKVQEHRKKITFLPNGGFLKVKSFDPKIVTGSKPTGVLVDELHVISEFPEADRVLGQLKGGMIPNPEAFMVTITTQSERPPSGVFKAALTTARRVRDGEITLPILPVLYELPADVDWKDPANWAMVTPNNGKSITVDRLLVDFEAAKDSSDEELMRWASQHLNVEIGLRLRADRWGGANYWEAAHDKTLTSLEVLLARSEVAVIGIDGGGLDDLLALCVTGREKGTRNRLMWFKAWAHETVLERRKEIVATLRDFERDGDLTIYKDMGEDIDELVEIVEQVQMAGILPSKHCIGVDVAGIGEIPDALMDPDGLALTTEHILAVPQGWKLWGVIQSLERRLASRTSLHCGQALAAWAVSNAKLEPRGNAMVMTKSAAGRAKIDPVIAALNAEMLMDRNPQAKPPSVYETRGLRVL